MNSEHILHYDQNQTNDPYVKLVKINTSEYFDYCWLKVAPSSTDPVVRSTDPSYVYSNTESFLLGIENIPLGVVGSVMNLLVILATLRSCELRKEYLTPSILSLALNDFIFSITFFPITSILGFMKDLPLPHGQELFGFVIHGLYLGSIVNLLEIAVLRVLVVSFPQICKTEKFQRACLVAPISVWVFSMITLVPVLSRKYGRFGLMCKSFNIEIIDVYENGTPSSRQPWLIFIGPIVASGALLIMLNIITYIQVHRKTQKLFMQIKDTNLETGKKILQKEKAVGKMVVLVAGSYFLVYCPYLLLLTVDQYATISKRTASICIGLLSLSLVVIDPMIYFVSNEKYRVAIKSMLEDWNTGAYDLFHSIADKFEKAKAGDSGSA